MFLVLKVSSKINKNFKNTILRITVIHKKKKFVFFYLKFTSYFIPGKYDINLTFPWYFITNLGINDRNLLHLLVQVTRSPYIMSIVLTSLDDRCVFDQTAININGKNLKELRKFAT